jgi:hypothetical protein
MGTSWYSNAGIGVVIDFDEHYPVTERIEHSCEHPERIGVPFCPKCGKAVKDTIVNDRDMGGLDDYLHELENQVEGSWMATNMDPNAGKNRWFFGWGSSMHIYDDAEAEKVPPYDDLVRGIQALFGTLESMFKEYDEEMPFKFKPEEIKFHHFMTGY